MNLASVSIHRAYLQFSHLGIAGLKVAGVNMDKPREKSKSFARNGI